MSFSNITGLEIQYLDGKPAATRVLHVRFVVYILAVFTKKCLSTW